MKTLTTFVLLALLLAAGAASALDQEGGIRFVVGDPAGEFGESAADPGFGVALHYGLRPARSLTLGAAFDVMIYGSDTTEIDLPLVEPFDLVTTNNLASGYLFAQWRPLRGRVQPYAEARVGLRYLWTESKLQDTDWWDDDEVARETNFDDWASYCGGGGGLLIRLSHGNRAKKKPGVWLDLKVMSLQGAEAAYLTEGDILIRNDVPVFRPSQSETDLLSYELGVVMTF
jgi:hypothetical protein